MEQWTVWVGGAEVTDHYLDEQTAAVVAATYVAAGYDDVTLERIN